MGVSILTKMSVKTMECDIDSGKKERTHIARVWGIARGIKTAKDPRTGDPVYGLTGDFRGRNIDDTETEYQSGVLYLPGGVNEMLVAAVDTGELDKNEKQVFAEVKFALDVYSKPSSSPAGYQYECVPLVDVQENDAMAELTNSLPDLPALPSPEKKGK